MRLKIAVFRLKIACMIVHSSLLLFLLFLQTKQSIKIKIYRLSL